MNLGLAIKSLRKNKGITQTQFCKMIGITQSYLSLIETGAKEPSITVIKNISNALSTPLPILFWFTLTEEDVPKGKIEMFKSLKSAVDDLVTAFFN